MEALLRWVVLLSCLGSAKTLELPKNNSIADERARWSCRDCNSSVDWSPALNQVDIETGTMPLDLQLEMPFSLQVEKEFDGSFWTAVSRKSWYASYAAAGAYLAFILLGKEFMRDREAWDLKRSLAFWNLFLAVFSFAGAVRTVPQLVGALMEYGFAYTVCRRAVFYYGNGPAGFWVCLFIFSKYLELIDTVFLVMRKRKVRFLHWYHHFSVLLYCWHAYTWEMPTGLYFAAMNYTVHAVMYFYYFLSGWLLQLQSMRWEQLETSIPKELGRCQALWSSSEQAAVIWSCHGSWCFVPGKEPEKEKSTNASPWSSKFPKLDDLRLPLADAMAPAPAVGTPKASLPPVRAGPWKACRGEAEAFHQSWPQQVTPRKEKRSVNSAVGRERPRKASREVQGRELGPVKPPRARPPMKC